MCAWFCVSVSDFQPLQQLAVQVKKQSVCVKRKETKLSHQAEVSIHISGLTHPAHGSNQFVLMFSINTKLKLQISDHLCFIVKCMFHRMLFFFLWLFTNSYCNCGCFCLSLLMGRRTWCRQNGSLSWGHWSWSSPERKSSRFSTRALSKTWRVCSRSGTRRPSWSLAGGRSTVISQRWEDRSLPVQQPVFSTGRHLALFCAVLQLEDLVKVEGMTEKRFSSFMKVS